MHAMESFTIRSLVS